jgi:hypothetical protein
VINNFQYFRRKFLKISNNKHQNPNKFLSQRLISLWLKITKTMTEIPNCHTHLSCQRLDQREADPIL